MICEMSSSFTLQYVSMCLISSRRQTRIGSSLSLSLSLSLHEQGGDQGNGFVWPDCLVVKIAVFVSQSLENEQKKTRLSNNHVDDGNDVLLYTKPELFFLKKI